MQNTNMHNQHTEAERIMTATEPDWIRSAIAKHREWIESVQGVDIEKTVVLRASNNFTSLAARQLLKDVPLTKLRKGPIAKLRAEVTSIEYPNSMPPLVSARMVSRSSEKISDRQSAWKVTWGDTPVAIRLKQLKGAVVTLAPAPRWVQTTLEVKLLEMNPDIKHFNYNDDWKSAVLECPRCHWSGKFMDGSVEFYRELMDSSCPKCDSAHAPMLAIVNYPTLEELRSSGDPADVFQAGVIEQFRKTFEAQKLKSSDQLPDLDAPSFALVWDFVQAHDERRTVL